MLFASELDQIPGDKHQGPAMFGIGRYAAEGTANSMISIKTSARRPKPP
jgi:hypothetical protein